jgi:hypothetical protein
MNNRCRCGRPCPDAFLCRDCAERLALDLEALSHYLPELTVVLTRQQRTTDGRTRRPAPAELAGGTPAAPPARKLTASESGVSLVATALQFDPAASALLTEARNTLSTWCRHLLRDPRHPPRTHPGGRVTHPFKPFERAAAALTSAVMRAADANRAEFEAQIAKLRADATSSSDSLTNLAKQLREDQQRP